MDAVELARQAAEALHVAAVTKGQDPWAPYDLALAVAGACGLEVERVKAGSPLLQGGRARFEPDGRMISHEDAGSLFDQAFLVGHELGHATQGDDQVADVAGQVDPALPAEAAPVGEERVVDYSRRQRREVQMDLFGRELLMPRSWLRTLHLQGMGASQIAERLGASFDAVAQQLLDALLLPTVSIKAAEPKPEIPLNLKQKAAALHRGAPYLLEAGPGTGKTQTLVGRVHALLDEDVDPRNILVLTFSNKAAGELSDRIASAHPAAAAAMSIGTFHAFGLDLIRRFHKELGFPHEPRMMDRTEAVELLELEFPRLGLQHYRNLWDPGREIGDMLGAISRAKDEVADHLRYAQLAADMGARAAAEAERVAAARCAEVAKTFKAYEDLKREAVAVDFGDLVALPVILLRNHPAVRDELRGRYLHILVDEYQDVNRSSVHLLQLLTDAGRNLWAVGDARQAIYRFRGASSFNMVRFGTEDFPGAQHGRLDINYRSTKEIVDAYSTFGAGMIAGGQDAALTAHRGPSGDAPEHRIVRTTEDDAAGLAETILTLRAEGHAYRDQAVLCTGNERLARLGRELEQRGVPVLYLGSLFERPEIKDLLAWLMLLIDRRAMGLARRRAPDGFNPELGDVAAIIDHLKNANPGPLQWLIPGAVPGLSAASQAALVRVGEALQGFTPAARPWDVLTLLLLDRTRIAAEIASSSEVADRARGLAIWQFMNFLRVQPPAQGLPIQVLLERIRRLVQLADERDLRQLPLASNGIDAVRLMTIHGSKGLEFPVVHVMGLNQNSLPRTAPDPPCPPPDGLIEGSDGSGLEMIKAGRLEEQECVFYVALSRARDRLFIYSAAQTTSGGVRHPSPYLARLGPGLVEHRLAPAAVLPDPDLTPLPVRFEGALSYTDAQLAQFEKCPRRFFYTYVLQTGGRRATTPFTDMHEVVSGLVTAFAALPLDALAPPEVTAAFESTWAAHPVSAYGYADDLRGIARSLVDYYVSSRQGHASEPPASLRLAVPGGEVVVTPDEVLVGPSGARAVRRIRTGHKRSADEKGIAAAAFQLAASEAFPGCRVELIFLGDGEPTALEMKAKALSNRRTLMTEMLAAIAAGKFEPKESSFTCPRCPAFFICGPTPSGTLVKKI